MTVKPIVIDNGGAYLRIGISGMEGPKTVKVNAIARNKKDKKILICDKILASPSYILSRPMNRGLIEDWETQKLIWEKNFEKKNFAVITIAPFAPEMAKKDMYELLFSEFQFQNCLVIESSIAAQFSPGIVSQFTKDDWDNPCGLLIDVGFSNTYVIPVFNTLPVPGASVRLPIGGRVLNNILKERLAYSQVDLEDNPLLIQNIRETICEVRLKNSEWNEKKYYLLPDFAHFGKAIDSACPNSIQLSADRFAVYETLFTPKTFGVDSIGLAECVELSISKCPAEMREAMWKKIILVGGLAMAKGFVDRLKEELPVRRILTETDGRFDLSVWRGAASFNQESDLAALGAVNRDQWY